MNKTTIISVITSWIATVLIISGVLVSYQNSKNTNTAPEQNNIINEAPLDAKNSEKNPDLPIGSPANNNPAVDSSTPSPSASPISSPDNTPASSPAPTSKPTPGPTPSPQQGITAAQVATHNTSGNCWLIISNKVYNLTSFLSIHSGGASVITPYCGKDATNYFLNRHPQGSYINYLITHLYYQGNLASAPTPTPTAIPTPNTTPTPTPTPINTPTPGPTPTPQPGITAAQVATHNNSGDCWLIISNKVYDLTNFLNIHSGGASKITSYCGLDATTYFLNEHPQNSYINYLVTHLYYQGDLSIATPTPTPTPPPGGTPTPTTTPTPITYTATISSNGTTTPSSLNIAVNDTVKFVYSGGGDEIKLRFTPNPPANTTLDHERTQMSYKFTQSGTYTMRIDGTTRLTITVQ